MSSLLTNTSAMSALASLTATQRQLSTTQAQVSSGLAVANASDNAAYWSIATKMRSEVAGLSAVQQSLSMTGALMAVTSTAIGQIIGLVQGIGADLVTAQEAGVDRGSVQSYIAARQASLRAIVNSASFNGVNLLKSASSSAGMFRQDSFPTITPAQYYAGFTGDVEHQVVVAPVENGNVIFDPSRETTYSDTAHSAGPGTFRDNASSITYDIDNFTYPRGGDATIFFPSSFDGSARSKSVDLSSISMVAPISLDVIHTLAFSNGPNAMIYTNGGLSSVTEGSGILDRPLGSQGMDGTFGDSVLNLDVTSMSPSDLAAIAPGLQVALVAIQSAASTVGSVQTQVSTMQSYNSSLSDALTSGIGSLVDADMNVASTRLQALQTQQQLGIQALSMANQNSSLILKLFQAA